jgi:hypothetical protein
MTAGFRPCLALACATALLFTGCASVKTLPGGGASDATRMRRPSGIYVRPFETTGGMWQRDASSAETRREIRDWLAGSLLRDLAAMAPTHLLEGETTMPNSGWLVTGRFLRVDPGSRAKRLFLGGIGAGASKLETRVDVFDLAVSSTEPILSFATTGGSNLSAGIPGAMTGMDDDVERTAREILDYLEAHVWPAESKQGRPDAPTAIEEVGIKPTPRGSR